MGWNSFDSYGVYLYEEAAFKLVDVMADKYKDYGYEYFVIDAGWFGEFDKYPGTRIAKGREPSRVNIDEFGILQPSQSNFPNGFRALIDTVHAKGLKFGLHMMRGIPREAVKRNTLVKGTKLRARDIADVNDTCSWSSQNYGIDMSKPGAQEYYDSVIEELAAWGVDFIKYDDIVPYPEEVAAVTEAIKKCGKDIVLSLSPGVNMDTSKMHVYGQADMLRVTNDIWDVQKGIDVCFAAWRKWSGTDTGSLWVDMDMIPFGKLQVLSPDPQFIRSLFIVDIESELSERNFLYSGRGYTRWSELSKDQKKTFITMRALAASPLFIGGDLLTMDDFSYSLLTDRHMIECNKIGKIGHMVYEKDGIEVWKSESEDSGYGYVGVFNRNQGKTVTLKLTHEILDLDKNSGYSFYDVWAHSGISIPEKYTVPSNGVVFIKYSSLCD